jgi:redox-sensitive bicupin YhaK (pirin superfamily)
MDRVETVIVPRAHDVGGFEVHRALPAREKQMVGPFIFFDQMGPGEFLTGRGLDVRPHPHIGLATVTYLFEGSIYHRDSLGTQLPIVPGDVNWMTAGRGIAHSERTDAALRGGVNRLFGIQSWAALPKTMEETAPAFAHHEAASLPVLASDRRGWMGVALPGRDVLAAVLCGCFAGAGGGAAAAGSA